MLRLSVLDQTLADVRAKKAKAAALLQKLEEPKYALERLAAEEAKLVAQRQQAEQEAAQLEAERASVMQDLALFDAIAKDHAAWLRYQDGLVAICERGMLGDARPVARVRVLGNTQAPEHAATLRARLAGIDARLKELDQ